MAGFMQSKPLTKDRMKGLSCGFKQTPHTATRRTSLVLAPIRAPSNPHDHPLTTPAAPQGPRPRNTGRGRGER